MKIKILFAFFIYNWNSYGQHIEFQYDDNGNRTKRKLVIPRLADPNRYDTLTTNAVALKSIELFPNPTSDFISVKINGLKEGQSANVILSTNEGKVILYKKQYLEKEALDMNSLKAGIYYIKIDFENEHYSGKVVKLE